MATVTLNVGTIHYEKVGPAGGRPIVFVHGYAMGGSLWRSLTEPLAADGYLCVAPTWPLGAHPEPMRPDAELTMDSIAAMVSELFDVLDLEDVVLVGNDTGGAIAQLVAGRAPARLGALVLTSCDAFEHFPPPILKPLIAAAKLGFAFDAALQPMRARLGRKIAYGALAHADIDHLASDWARCALASRGTRRDLRRFTASLHRETMIDAAARLPRFTRPALVAWSADDAFFPLQDAHRLVEVLPDSRLEVIENSRTFSMIDQPESLAALISGFAAAGSLGSAA